MSHAVAATAATSGASRPRTWFITGGTPGGFGMAYAQAALDAGDQVVLTARRIEPPDRVGQGSTGAGFRC